MGVSLTALIYKEHTALALTLEAANAHAAYLVAHSVLQKLYYILLNPLTTIVTYTLLLKQTHLPDYMYNDSKR